MMHLNDRLNDCSKGGYTMHVDAQKLCEIRRVADLPLIIVGIATPFVFLLLVLFERDYQIYEGLISFFSFNYGLETLIVYADFLFFILPFAGLLIAVLSKVLLCKGKAILDDLARLSVNINLFLVIVYSLVLLSLFPALI